MLSESSASWSIKLEWEGHVEKFYGHRVRPCLLRTTREEKLHTHPSGGLTNRRWVSPTLLKRVHLQAILNRCCSSRGSLFPQKASPLWFPWSFDRGLISTVRSAIKAGELTSGCPERGNPSNPEDSTSSPVW